MPSEEIIKQIAKKVLLTPDEVKFSFKHLHQIHQNRKSKQHKQESKRLKKKELTQNIHVKWNRDLKQTVDEGDGVAVGSHGWILALRPPEKGIQVLRIQAAQPYQRY